MTGLIKRLLVVSFVLTALVASEFACHDDASHFGAADGAEHICVCMCHSTTAPAGSQTFACFERRVSRLTLCHAEGSGLDFIVDIFRPPLAS